MAAVNTLALSPNNQTLISGSTDSTIKLWNLHTEELLYTLTGHSTAVLSVAITPDGQTLASSSRDGIIKLWNLQTGEVLQTLSGGSPVAFSPDGKILVSGGNNGSIKICHQKQNFNESVLNPILSGEWWEILGVHPGNHRSDIKEAYLQLARQYHPDVNNSATAKASMQAINQAYKEFLAQFNADR